MSYSFPNTGLAAPLPLLYLLSFVAPILSTERLAGYADAITKRGTRNAAFLRDQIEAVRTIHLVDMYIGSNATSLANLAHILHYGELDNDTARYLADVLLQLRLLYAARAFLVLGVFSILLSLRRYDFAWLWLMVLPAEVVLLRLCIT
jgi:hypothetical protein